MTTYHKLTKNIFMFNAILYCHSKYSKINNSIYDLKKNHFRDNKNPIKHAMIILFRSLQDINIFLPSINPYLI